MFLEVQLPIISASIRGGGINGLSPNNCLHCTSNGTKQAKVNLLR